MNQVIDERAQCLQQTLRDFDGAFQNFFGGRAGYPQLRRKDGGADRFRFPDPANIRRENDFLYLPKLGADMTASAAGTVEAPGSHVRQKAGPNRFILDRGWGELVRQLRYKLEWQGGSLIEVNAA